MCLLDFVSNKDPPKVINRSFQHHPSNQIPLDPMKTQKLLRSLDGADRVLGKLAKLASKACVIAKLIYDLYKIVDRR